MAVNHNRVPCVNMEMLFSIYILHGTFGLRGSNTSTTLCMNPYVKSNLTENTFSIYKRIYTKNCINWCCNPEIKKIPQETMTNVININSVGATEMSIDLIIIIANSIVSHTCVENPQN